VKLVAGLGNPGPRYRGTRHNLGFDVVDQLVARHGLETSAWRNLADTAEWRRSGERVLLVKPLTFMNLSGEAVSALMSFYKIDLDEVLIVCDDVNLPLGRLRARRSGSEGGNNGLKSISASLGTTGYMRLRIGAGRGDPRRDLADHVLSRFAGDERSAVETAIDRAADAVELWIAEGITPVMNAFNRADDAADDAGGVE